MSDSKAIVNMTNWQLYVYEDHYSLSGTADNHPSLGKNTYVSRTSSMASYTYENEVLTYETRNTIYTCPLKYMTPKPYRNVVPGYLEVLAKRSEKSNSPLDMIIEVAARIAIISELSKPRERRLGWPEEDSFTVDDANYFKNDFVEHVIDIQKKGQQEIIAADEAVNMALVEAAQQYDDCVYIEVSNVSSGSKLAYNIDGHTGVIEPSIHSGMFQDSILYMKYRSENDDFALDFRYFPRGIADVMETYSWSDNISQAVIKNDCSYRIEFNHELIEPGEAKIFTPKGHVQGLISPDCYNGKSILSAKNGGD